MDTLRALEALKGTGLPEKAALVYVSLLGKRKKTLSELAKDSGLKRATCYEYVDMLLEKDFIVRVPVGKRMYYAAVSPERILKEFRKRVVDFEERVGEMVRVHEAAIQKPRVSFYEGKREIRRIYDDLFNIVGEVRSIFPPEAFFENFSEADYNELDKTLTEHAIQSKDLFVADSFYKRIREIRARNGGDKSDKKLPSWFTSNVDVLIYSEKVALISLRDLSAVVIENKDIADLFRNLHEGMWKMS